jgi:hypothetical protein
VTCKQKITAITPVKEKEKTYTIEATAESYSDSDTSITVKAIIKADGNAVDVRPEGYTIYWTRTGAGVPKIKEPEKKKSSAVGDVVEDKKDKKDEKTVDSGKFADDVVSVSAPRVDAEYKVTAHLVKDKKDVDTDDEDIPRLSSSNDSMNTIPRNYVPSQGGAAPPSSGPMDTSAGAITE